MQNGAKETAQGFQEGRGLGLILAEAEDHTERKPYSIIDSHVEPAAECDGRAFIRSRETFPGLQSPKINMRATE